MKFSKLVIIIIFTISIISCNKDDDQNITQRQNCPFVQNDDDMDGLIDENERGIMTACQENGFTSKIALENNLIGEWKLIGHGDEWSPTKSQPCASITFSRDEFVYELTNEFFDTVATFGYEIEESVRPSGDPYFFLKIQAGILNGLFINQFCADHMFGDATPLDGNMYLYEKVN